MPIDFSKLTSQAGDFFKDDALPALQSLRDRAGNYLQSEDFNKILPFLLSGGAGALAGGAVTGRRRGEQGEGRAGYLARILRNMLLTGGLAAGGHYLLGKGLESTVGPLGEEKAISGAKNNEAPLATAVKNVAFSPLTAGLAGATVLGATHDNKIIGAGNTADNLSRFASETPSSRKLTPKLLKVMTPDEIAALGGNQDVRRLAGLPSSALDKGHEFIYSLPWVAEDADRARATKGVLSSLLRRGPLSTFGQTNMRRAGRGALGLAAAGVPALLGALLTNKS